MPTYIVSGADRNTGEDVRREYTAPSAQDAEYMANQDGVLVSHVEIQPSTSSSRLTPAQQSMPRSRKIKQMIGVFFCIGVAVSILLLYIFSDRSEDVEPRISNAAVTGVHVGSQPETQQLRDRLGDTLTIEVPGDYITIQDAINASADGDTIAIAAGTYFEHNINNGGKAITIRSASGLLDVTIDAQQKGGVIVLLGSGVTLNNLLITGAGGGGLRDVGGFGIHCNQSSQHVISNCTVTGNTSVMGGGGIIVNGSNNITIVNCTITNNIVFRGGGIVCNSSNPIIQDCTIKGNTGKTYGGGIDCYKSSPRITRCEISDNTVGTGSGFGKGGGMYCHERSSPTITDCNIFGNTSDRSGGGIYCADGSHPIIRVCTIRNNTAKSYGGGVAPDITSSPSVTKTVICGNRPKQIFNNWRDKGRNMIDDSCP